MARGSNNNLPVTTAENILILINTLKRKNKNEDEAKAIFGKGGTAYTSSKSAIRAFGLIEKDSLDFTKDGREIAFSQDIDKKTEMIKILKNYAPYEVFLFSLLKKDDVIKTDIDEIVNFWGKANYGSTQRNREDAAKLFMSIIEFTGLGKYIKGGRGSNSTRIEWVSDIKNRINSLNQVNPIDEQKKNINSQGKDTDEASVIDTVPDVEEQIEQQIGQEMEDYPSTINEDAESNSKPTKKSISAVSFPNITINVDMSGDWSDEKIKIFFKYAYGKFEED